MHLRTLKATIGKREHPIQSWAAVSAAYTKTIAELRLPAGDVPRLFVVDNHGKVVAHLDHQGTVWPGNFWKMGAVPIYRPH